MSALRGQVVWVTGASSGIGQAVARELMRRGCRVALTARNVEALERLSEEEGEAAVFPADIADREAVHAAAARIAEHYGPIDIAFLNAGAYDKVTPDTFGADVFRPHVEVNIMGTVHCIESVLPDMRKNRRGRIAVVASVAGFTGMPLASAYGASKAFLINMCQSLDADLYDSGVHVTVVAPGFVESGLTEKNSFSMPMLMETPDAARTIADGLESGAAEIAFPLPVVAWMRGQQVLPGPVRRYLATRTARRVYEQEGQG